MMTLSGTIMPMLWLDPSRPMLSAGVWREGGAKRAHQRAAQDGRAARAGFRRPLAL